MADESLTLAYILWMICELLGVRHFYLGHYLNSFMWFWTSGALLVGWALRDGWLSSYIDTIFAEETRRIERGLRPPFSWKRAVGELTFGVFLGWLAVSAASNEFLLSLPYLALIGSVFVAFGKLS